MNERVLRVLEYHKIVDQLIGHAATSMGKERARSIVPQIELGDVNRSLLATDEGQLVYRVKGLIPFGGIRDIRQSVKRSEVGSTLDAKDLLDVADTIMAGRRLKKFIADVADDHPIPILSGYAESIFELKSLEEEIRGSIDNNAEVMDHASPELKRIRNELRASQGRVKERLDSILRSAANQKMMQEPIVTIRNDRYCIPVKAEHKGAFGGIIHDQSASGATLFIEPASVVQLSNQIREWEIQEQREIEKILARLSGVVGANADELQIGLEAIGEIDFIIAKAALAHQMKATLPIMNDQGVIHVRQARHPMIDRNVAVPIDVQLGDSFILLVITGPNTGGKTVTLKTIGLLTLMAMSGLHIPALEGSRLSTFEDVFADIGDEQSIEQNLSTFSSHMTNIIHILEHVNFRTLVLFDELGAGTDPTEGAALAMSILDFLHQRGVRTVATTHYSELKAYAYSEKGAINASVEFDVESLRPTYRLLIGVPGRSNAFAISERLGLRLDIIEHAKSKLTTEDMQVDDLIRQLETHQFQAEEHRKEAERIRRELEILQSEFEREQEHFLQNRERMIEKAEEEARSVVRKAQREAEEIVEELRKIREEQHQTFKEHELIELRKRLEGSAPTRRERRVQRNTSASKQQEITNGDTVLVLTLNQKGTVLELDGNQALVQIGSMKTKMKKDALQFVEKPKQDTKGIVKRRDPEGGRVGFELDIRGATVDEAIPQIDKHLDDSIMNGLSTISIIHGKGTGALRSGVQEFLRTHRQVRSFRYGVHGEGGDGVTIVLLK